MIKSKIGKSAVLEQLAEECCELAQISLKRARILRGENPTPKTITETDANFLEEIADVLNCIFVVADISRKTCITLCEYCIDWLKRMKDKRGVKK